MRYTGDDRGVASRLGSDETKTSGSTPSQGSDPHVRTADYDYDLPSGLIAQSPLEPRDSCRLLVVDRASGQIDHRRFSDLGEYLEPGDLIVLNETRVLPARLRGVKADSGGAAEVLLLRERGEDTWEALVKPGRRLQQTHNDRERREPALHPRVPGLLARRVQQPGANAAARDAHAGHDGVHV